MEPRNVDHLLRRRNQSETQGAIDRRNFVKYAAGLIVGGSVSSLLTSCAAPAATPASATGSSGLMGNGEKYPYIYYLTSISYWDMHLKGMEDACKLLNVTFDKAGPAGADVEAEVTAIEQAISEKVPGLIVAAIVDDVIAKPINQAIDAGIPVVTCDASSDTSKQLCYVGTPNEEAGYLSAKRLIEMMGGQGKIILTTTTVAAPAKAMREIGFRRAVTETNGAVEIVAKVDDGDRAEVAVQSVGQAIQANPDANGIFTISAGAGLGTIKALQEAGRDDIKAGAFANDQAAYKLTKERPGTFIAA
ncbi:MAG TPA: substrate-binding domain-containing protein, partial [Anaerolineae bacterium]|nr:substrate-binding domain-containing protein [Anaerolineae bacterium]